MAPETPPLRRDDFLSIKRATPGDTRISLWLVAVMLTVLFGALICHTLTGTPRIVFGTITAMLLLFHFAWAIFQWRYERRLSALVARALATNRTISAKRLSPYRLDLSAEGANTIRVTEWMMRVLRRVPGLQLSEEE